MLYAQRRPFMLRRMVAAMNAVATSNAPSANLEQMQFSVTDAQFDAFAAAVRQMASALESNGDPESVETARKMVAALRLGR